MGLGDAVGRDEGSGDLLGSGRALPPDPGFVGGGSGGCDGGDGACDVAGVGGDVIVVRVGGALGGSLDADATGADTDGAALTTALGDATVEGGGRGALAGAGRSVVGRSFELPLPNARSTAPPTAIESTTAPAT